MLSEKLFPKYIAAYWKLGVDTPINVYPAKDIVMEIFEKMNKRSMELYGLKITPPKDGV